MQLEDPSFAATLTPGSSFTVPIIKENQTRYYSFTPTTSGNYTLYSTGSNDTYATVYCESIMNQPMASDNNSGDNKNFKLTCYLDARKTYIYAVKINSSSTGSFTIRLKKE
jgi:tyrosinase